MSDLSPPRYTAEVVQSSSTTIVAHCNSRDRARVSFPDPPALGSFVSIPEELIDSSDEKRSQEENELDPFANTAPSNLVNPSSVFGVVGFIQTTSLDQGRRAVAMGAASLDELRLTQPQIFELITVEITVVITSYSLASGEVLHRLPPKPSHLHSPVYECKTSDVLTLTGDFGFLRTLLSASPSGTTGTADLVAAAIRTGYEVRHNDEQYLVAAGRALLRFVGNDYDRFQSIMQRLA